MNIIKNSNFCISKNERKLLRIYNKYFYKIYNNNKTFIINKNNKLNRIISILFFIKKDFDNLLKLDNSEILTIYYLENNNFEKALNNYNSKDKYDIMWYFNDNTFVLGFVYELGKEYIVAIELYKLYIKKNKSNITENVYFRIGLCYYNLNNYDKAINYFLLSYQTHKTDNLLLYNISKYYYDIKKDYSQSKKYLLLSAKYGNFDAINRLGIYYETIIGDIDTALRYYKLSSDNDNPDSQINLGNHYYYSKGNYGEALKYYFLVINNSNSNDKIISIALYNIGKYYKQVLINPTKAIKYLKLSFEKGFLDAGLLLLSIDEKYLSLLETSNNNNILIGIAKYFEKKDINKTIEYYNKAFENDNKDIRVLKYLYNYYFQNFDDKYKIYLDIIICNYSSECAYLLGDYYNIIKDYDNSIKYYLIGINNNCVHSMNNLGIHYLINTNYKLAYKYLIMAYNKGDTTSIYNIGYYYELINDIPNAIKYYKECIQKSEIFYKGTNALENLFIKYPQYLIKELTTYDLSYIHYYKHSKLVYIKNNFIIDNFECDICYDKHDNYLITKCKHKYCINCFVKLDTCAFCRKTFI